MSDRDYYRDMCIGLRRELAERTRERDDWRGLYEQAKLAGMERRDELEAALAAAEKERDGWESACKAERRHAATQAGIADRLREALGQIADEPMLFQMEGRYRTVIGIARKALGKETQ